MINILYIKGVEELGLVAGNTVIISFPDRKRKVPFEQQKGVLAHLLGHALGLEHPRQDIDTEGSRFDSHNSFMDPSVLVRGLSESIILDSQLNSEKAKLIFSGFFPYEGRIYTVERDGAVPLYKGITLESSIKVAHGLYIFPCKPQEPAIIISPTREMIVDLGSAIVRGEQAQFQEFGEHITYGVGILIDGKRGDGNNITVKGGVISGFHYGLLAKNLRQAKIEGVSVVAGRRMQSDASRPINDELRGHWLNFWFTPEDDLTERVIGVDPTTIIDAYSAYGAGIALVQCANSEMKRNLVSHGTVGISDFYGLSNKFEGNDLSECPMGLRFWQARGTRENPILVRNNIFHFNTQPFPYWWQGGDGAAILGAGVRGIKIEENTIYFGGDGIFFCGFPFPPGEVEEGTIMENVIENSFAHGIELDFSQNFLVKNNRISGSWLSGIWAGHSAGIIVYNNVFERNNRGRMFSNWTSVQGAITCPEGRITAVGNMFKENWVAINLWEDFSLPWWIFSGDAEGHIVVGNTFLGNEIGVRLNGIRHSEVINNKFLDNHQDVVSERNYQGNIVENNGPQVNPNNFPPVVHISHQKVLLTNLEKNATLSLILITPTGLRIVSPDRTELEFPNDDRWIQLNVNSEGIVNISAIVSSDFAGLKSGRLTIGKLEKERSIPIKFMGGGSSVVVNKEVRLGDTTFPSCRFGFFTPISLRLGTPEEVSITGLEPFEIGFWRDDRPFVLSEGIKEWLVVVDSDGVTKLWLIPTEDPSPLGNDKDLVFSTTSEVYSDWHAKRITLDPGSKRVLFWYFHKLPTNLKEWLPPAVHLLLVPLDEIDIQYLGQKLSLAKKTNENATLMNFPGSHRIQFLNK